MAMCRDGWGWQLFCGTGKRQGTIRSPCPLVAPTWRRCLVDLLHCCSGPPREEGLQPCYKPAARHPHISTHCVHLLLVQWPVMRRHAPEILGATSASATFSMLSTAAFCRLVALPPGVASCQELRACVMRLWVEGGCAAWA